MGMMAAVFGLAWLGLAAPNGEVKSDVQSNESVVKVAENVAAQAPVLIPITPTAANNKTEDGLTRVISDAANLTTATIYPDNLALITEVRKVTVPEGTSVIAFEGVSDLIIPQSMILREFTGLTLERNFDYDLLSKTTLFENAIGDLVTLTRFDKASGAVVNQQAEIVSARRDTGVVMRVDGKVETLSCSGLKDRVSFGVAEEGLTAKPVMSVQVSAETAGEQEVVISYLTSGLGWRADYRVDLKGVMEGKPVGTREASLLAWLTLTNGTAKDYADVPLAIIAGDLNRDRETRAVSPPKPYLQGQCYPIGDTKRGIAELIFQGVSNAELPPGLPMPAMTTASYSMGAMTDEVIVTARKLKVATEENVGDYKLYRVPGLVSVKPYQTKQIAFLDEDSVEIGRYFKADTHLFQSGSTPQSLTLTYDLNNDREEGLARSLPKGTFRIFDRRENGRTVFLGETRVDNLAVDEDVELTMSRAMSVQMKTELVETSRNKGTVTHSFFNALDEAARVKVVNDREELRGKKLYEPGTKREPDEIIPTWWLEVPSEGTAELVYGLK